MFATQSLPSSELALQEENEGVLGARAEGGEPC